MKQIPHLTYGEQFALDEWLSDYPEDVSYEVIWRMLMNASTDACSRVTPSVAGKRFTSGQIAEHMEWTRLHFERVVGSAFHE